MDTKLEWMVRKASILAQQKFDQTGGASPLFYCMTDWGQRIILDPVRLGCFGETEQLTETLKNTLSSWAEMVFAVKKVQRYVFISEAWMLATSLVATKEEMEEIAKILRRDGSLANHPKRVEIVAYQAEDMDGHAITGYQSVIRPAGAKPYLYDDLTMEDASGMLMGRMTNLLDFRKYVEARSK